MQVEVERERKKRMARLQCDQMMKEKAAHFAPKNEQKVATAVFT